jgi:hypothetical protein
VEASLTGSESVGGVQISVFEPRPGIFPDAPPTQPIGTAPTRASGPLRMANTMGLGAGGAMRQKIYTDAHGVDTWDPRNRGQVVVHIVNSEQFAEITNTQPPAPPIDAQTYTAHGLPWFDLYDESRSAIAGSERLSEARGIAARDAERGVEAANASFEIRNTQVRKLEPETSSTAGGRNRRTKGK